MGFAGGFYRFFTVFLQSSRVSYAFLGGSRFSMGFLRFLYVFVCDCLLYCWPYYSRPFRFFLGLVSNPALYAVCCLFSWL